MAKTQQSTDPGQENAPLSPLAKQNPAGPQDVTKPTASTDAHTPSLEPDISRRKNS